MGSAAKQANVLLVEDEPMIADMISDALIDEGFNVFAVADGEGALRYLESGSKVDVLFTDINLAGVMDGSELAERARELRPELPIVYASGRCSPSAMQPLVARSMFLPKPYSPIEVCTLISRMASA